MITSTELEILRTDLPGIERNFRQISPQQWQMSCSICGDSKKDRRKARFGIAVKDNILVCNCFNCGWNGTFLTYLRYQHPDLAQRVSRSKFVDKSESNHDLSSLVFKADSEILREIFYINNIPNAKEWLQYLVKKKIFLDKPSIRKLHNIHNGIHNER